MNNSSINENKDNITESGNEQINENQTLEEADTPATDIPFPDKYNLKFEYLCKVFEKIATLKPKDKHKLFEKFLKNYFEKAISSHISIFPLFRLTFPKWDRTRGSYGIAESFLGQLYTNILSLPEKEKLMLKHWKNPNFLPSGAPIGDFVNLVIYIINKRVTSNATITINEVNIHWTALSKAQSKDERTVILTKIIKTCTAQEQKWIISIILKDLKIGFSHESFFKYYNKSTLEILNNTSSLIEVCNYISNPKSEKYANTYYQLFSPIKPMLVARMTLNNILINFNGVNVLIESKWDGERIQCHLNNNEVKFFTRNGIDYTNWYGPKLSHLIKSCINAKSAILDGEVVVWDKKENKFTPFGENKTVALAENEMDKAIVFEIFDIIFLTSPQGEAYPLNNVILSDRKKILQRIVTPVPKKIEIVTSVETNSVDEIMNQFNAALTRGEEGIVIKKTDSIYKPDERCSDWVKMKCDYIDTIVDTLDLVIIGGYYGEGKRTGATWGGSLFNYNNSNSNSVDYSGNVVTFLLGVIKELNTTNPKKSLVMPIVKVGTGYSFKELSTIRDKLRTKWKNYDSRTPPALYGQWIPAFGDRPDLYIDDPSQSIILEVKAAEIVGTETFPTKVTLRFPRVVSVRHDKSWSDCLKYPELLQYYNKSTTNVTINNTLYDDSSSLQHNHWIKGKDKKQLLNTLANWNDDDTHESNATMNKKAPKFSRILENFRDTDTSNITKLSELFSECQFLVLSLDDVISQNSVKKKMIEYAIVENGGEKVQNYLPTTTHVISEKIDLKIKNILKVHDINVYNMKWVYDCINFKKILKESPMYLTYCNKQTKNKWKLNMDKYNDSYYEDIDMDILKEIFKGMKDVSYKEEVKESKLFFEKTWIDLRKEYVTNKINTKSKNRNILDIINKYD